MPDRLDDLRRAFAETDAPDLWPEIQRRAELASADVAVAPMRSAWRVPAWAAATLLVIVGVIAALSVRDDEAQVAATGSDHNWTDLHVPVLDWRLEHPVAWKVQLFEHQCRIGESGAVITNVDHPIEREVILDGCTTGWDLIGVSSGFVGVEVTYRAGGPATAPAPSASDTHRPLRLEEFDRIDDLTLHEPITIAGEARYAVRVWIGQDASAGDVAAVERIVRSIEWTSDCGTESGSPCVGTSGA
jgi:hypothetical protein